MIDELPHVARVLSVSDVLPADQERRLAELIEEHGPKAEEAVTALETEAARRLGFLFRTGAPRRAGTE